MEEANEKVADLEADCKAGDVGELEKQDDGSKNEVYNIPEPAAAASAAASAEDVKNEDEELDSIDIEKFPSIGLPS